MKNRIRFNQVNLLENNGIYIKNLMMVKLR